MAEKKIAKKRKEKMEEKRHRVNDEDVLDRGT